MESNPDIDPGDVFDFVQNPFLQHLREEAILGDEFASGNLWGRVGEHLFPEKKYLIVKENPPANDHNQTRMDFALKVWLPVLDGKTFPSTPIKHGYVLFVIGQGKRGKASPHDVATVEEQAFDMCESFVYKEKEVESVWLITYYGPKYRIWAYDVAFNQPVPFFPNTDKHSARDTYVDLRGSENSLKIVAQYIKNNPRPNTQEFDTALRTLGLVAA